MVKRNSIIGPGTWGVNLGVRKFFKFREGSTRLEVAADFNNVFNHPLYSPLDTSTFANLGDFDISLNSSGQPVILPANVHPNPNFGRNNTLVQSRKTVGALAAGGVAKQLASG